MALNEFEGTVMLVSHDRALLREVCDEFWLVAGGARRAVRRRPRRLPALAARAVEAPRASRSATRRQARQRALGQARPQAQVPTGAARRRPRDATTRPRQGRGPSDSAPTAARPLKRLQAQGPASREEPAAAPAAPVDKRAERQAAAAARQQHANALEPLRQELNQSTTGSACCSPSATALEALFASGAGDAGRHRRARQAAEGGRRADRGARAALARNQHASSTKPQNRRPDRRHALRRHALSTAEEPS